MTRFFIFFLLAIANICCTGSYSDGERLFRAGQYEQAISAFNNYLFLSPTDIKAIHLRARAYEELEEYPKAMEDYRRILQLDPIKPQALAGIGKIHFKLEDYRQAELYLLRAAKSDMDDFDILLLLGRALLVNQKYQAADEFLQFAKELEPQDSRVYFYQGMARSQIGDLLGAAGSFNMCLNYDNENVAAKYNRAMIYLLIGYPDWALQDFDAILSSNPAHVEALARRGHAKQQLGMEDACSDLKKAAGQGSSYAVFYAQNCN